MAAKTSIKVFSADREFVASFVYWEDAAILVAARGDGYTIRSGHSAADIVWTEGKEPSPASESYEYVARVCIARAAERREYWYKKNRGGELPADYVPARVQYASVFATLGEFPE